MQRIRPAEPADAAALARIYSHYVAHTWVSFEEQPVAPADMSGRIASVAAAGLPWLVLETAAGLAGYAQAAPWKTRSAYRHTAETSVYLVPDATGRGLGRTLYRQLLAELRQRGLHLAIAGIALPNEASVKLHEGLGFEAVGVFREVGFKLGRWVDVGYWQLRL